MLEATLRELLRTVRDEAAGDGHQATFVVHREQSHLMRIGNSSVSLNTSENLTRLDIRVLDGKREGTHTLLSDIKSIDQIRDALQLAVRKARVAGEMEYQPLFEIVENSVDETDQLDPALAILDPSVKANAYRDIFSSVGESYNYSGSWSSGKTELYLTSTANKNEAYHAATDMLFSIVLKHPEKRWELLATQTGWRSADFSVERVVKRLRDYLSVYEQQAGVKIEPGQYTVIFGQGAIAELLSMAAWTGFMGRYYEEKQSWTAHHAIGDHLLGDNVTIIDDPENDRTFRYGFDLAGKKRTRFPVVEQGVFKNLLYDLSASAKFGKLPTGHHGIQESFVMETGSGDPDPLTEVADRERVLYIPALHYMNIPNLSKGIFTASSRFSATVVDCGAMAAPLLSSRITDTFQNIFGNLSVISRVAASENLSDTYGRRMPLAVSVPSYVIAEGVRITDSADSF